MVRCHSPIPRQESICSFKTSLILLELRQTSNIFKIACSPMWTMIRLIELRFLGNTEEVGWALGAENEAWSRKTLSQAFPFSDLFLRLVFIFHTFQFLNLRNGDNKLHLTYRLLCSTSEILTVTITTALAGTDCVLTYGCGVGLGPARALLIHVAVPTNTIIVLMVQMAKQKPSQKWLAWCHMAAKWHSWGSRPFFCLL